MQTGEGKISGKEKILEKKRKYLKKEKHYRKNREKYMKEIKMEIICLNIKCSWGIFFP